MRLTSKGRYAVTAMLDVALWNNCFPVCVKMVWFPAYVDQAVVIC